MNMIKIVDSLVEYIDHMGTDKSVVNAARVSFANDDQAQIFDELKDTKLIGYLARHQHWTPFAHTSVTLKVKAPIFVARQLVKHQIGGTWNEVSRRYVDYEPEFHRVDVLRGRPVNAKQGSSDEIISPELVEVIYESFARDLATYNTLLEAGVCPEQARMVLPLGSMTDWYWTGSLMFWARVCRLRLDSHSQSETRVVAYQVNDIVAPLFPVSWAALMSE